jgi:hypothetical protein
MFSDRRMTVQMIADELQIGKTSIYSILTEDLEMKTICAKIVPKLLTPEQKLRRKQCFLFTKCKLVLHGRNVGDMALITAESTLLKGLKEEDFQGCFNQWKRRWDKCIASEGEYFDGDKNDVPEIHKIQIL